MTIHYDVPASLQEWGPLEKKQAGGAQMFGSCQIWSGTLAGCTKQFMAKPDSQKQRYEIMTDEEAGVGKTILGPQDILALAKRPDFPKN